MQEASGPHAFRVNRGELLMTFLEEAAQILDTDQFIALVELLVERLGEAPEPEGDCLGIPR